MSSTTLSVLAAVSAGTVLAVALAAPAEAPAPVAPAPGSAEIGAASAPPGPPGAGLAAGSAPAARAGPGSVTSPAPEAPVARARPRWRWPLEPRPPVVRPFVAPASSWGAGHRGLDLATSPGAPVRAVEPGRVTHAASLAGRGTVTVTHRDGLRSTYEPVAPSVSVGSEVDVGSLLGRVEPALGHCGVRACLHLGAVRDGYLDPLPLLTGGGRVRLLPLGGPPAGDALGPAP